MPTLVLLKGPHLQNEIPIPPGSTILGRHPVSDVVLTSPLIGRRAAIIEHTPPVTQIRDVQGHCGVVVNGTRLPNEGSALLEDGARVELGPYVFEYSSAEPRQTLDQLSSSVDFPRETTASVASTPAVEEQFAFLDQIPERSAQQHMAEIAARRRQRTLVFVVTVAAIIVSQIARLVMRHLL